MRRCEVYLHGIKAGMLTEEDNGEYTFTYDSSYLEKEDYPSVSLTLSFILLAVACLYRKTLPFVLLGYAMIYVIGVLIPLLRYVVSMMDYFTRTRV